MEQQNQTLEQYLYSYVNYQQDNWASQLYIVEFVYNNSWHSVTGYLPIQMYSRSNTAIGDNTSKPPIDVLTAQCYMPLWELQAIPVHFDPLM